MKYFLTYKRYCAIFCIKQKGTVRKNIYVSGDLCKKK